MSVLGFLKFLFTAPKNHEKKEMKNEKDIHRSEKKQQQRSNSSLTPSMLSYVRFAGRRSVAGKTEKR